jgi:hypothetical protein
MSKPGFSRPGPVKCVLPLAPLVAVAVGIAMWKRAPERPEISEAPAVLSPAPSPATGRAENAEKIIIWAGKNDQPAEKTDPAPRMSDIKPESSVPTTPTPQYDLASVPVETTAPPVENPKPAKVVEDTPLPRLTSDAPRPSGDPPRPAGERKARVSNASSYDSYATMGFKTPSGNIHCRLQGSQNENRATPHLRCDILAINGPLPPKPRNCDGNWGQAFSIVHDAQRVQTMCSTDAVTDDLMQTLPYGATWQQAGFNCISKPSGLTCTNRSGHGFALSRAAQKIF